MDGLRDRRVVRALRSDGARRRAARGHDGGGEGFLVGLPLRPRVVCSGVVEQVERAHFLDVRTVPPALDRRQVMGRDARQRLGRVAFRRAKCRVVALEPQRLVGQHVGGIEARESLPAPCPSPRR